LLRRKLSIILDMKFPSPKPLSFARARDFLLFLVVYIRKLLESPFHGSFDLVVRFLLGRISVGSMASALAVTDELVLPLRAVGGLAMAAGVSWEDMVVITQCASLGKLPNPIPFFAATGCMECCVFTNMTCMHCPYVL
jgi:hypothetical protein